MIDFITQTCKHIKVLVLVTFTVQFLSLVQATNKPLQVIYAVNAGGEEHTDRHGIRYEADPLHGVIGTASAYGKQLLMIGRVPQSDEILYQTERYHTANFGYEIPISGDGDYVLVLKFCEVYFNAPNMKVFDVVLNGEHTVIAELDIFQQVGKGVAHDEYIFFTVSRGKLFYKEEESDIKASKITIEFVKTDRDNPKINAFALLKGDVERVPRLPPLNNDDPTERSVEQDIINEDIIEKPTSTKARKTSGPRQPNPYSMDDSSVMLPVFIAIGAFIPLLFCLCKL